MCNIAILFLFILSFPYVVIVNNALTAIESLITLIVDQAVLPVNFYFSLFDNVTRPQLEY